ncbi:MAG: hypothetical protein AAF585_29375 [Verrucomicrobiota bacterium]
MPIVIQGTPANQRVLLGAAKSGKGTVLASGLPMFFMLEETGSRFFEMLEVPADATIWTQALDVSRNLKKWTESYSDKIRVRQFGSLAKVDIKPGDVVCIKPRKGFTDDEVRNIQSSVNNGAHLFVSMQGWAHKGKGDISQHIMNRLVKPYGFQFTTGGFQIADGEHLHVLNAQGQPVSTIKRRMK